MSNGLRSIRPGGRRGHTPSRAASSTDSSASWTVALPAWGDRYFNIMARATLPALFEAARDVDRRFEVVLWTDRLDAARALFASAAVPDNVSFTLRDVPGPDGAFASLSACHQQALDQTSGNNRLLLLTADMVVSCEVVARCEELIVSGMELVCCVPPRTIESDSGPPVGVSGRDLLAWGWDNRHRMTRECTWPDGRSYDVWRMYFEKDGEVAARVFLPHPLAVVPRGRRMHFAPTIDVNLTMNFAPRATYLITQPEEGAVVEVSPADKEFLETEPMHLRDGMSTPSCPPLIRVTNTRHRMFFSKRVIFKGSGGDCGDAEVVRRVLG